MIYKLKNTEGLDAKDLKSLIIDKNAKFLIFRYRIGLITYSIIKITNPILIKNEEENRHFKTKYNFLAILGLFEIFKGPFNIYYDIKSNTKETLDYTKDILHNIDYYNYKTGEITIKEAYILFDKLSKSDKKELIKSLAIYSEKNNSISKIFAAKYINVSNQNSPVYTIGIELKDENVKVEKELLRFIHKRFYKHLTFNFIYKNKDPFLFQRIEEQGDLVYEKFQ